MKQYSVHFSFYSEQYGDFEEMDVKVDAENQFEARRMAWALCDTNDDMKFASNLRVCGVTWNASPLDMQDYYNAEAAYEKYRLKYIENVELPNAKLNNNAESLDHYERQKYEHYGALGVIFRMASDFGRPYRMIPPTVYEELHYARDFLTTLEGCDDFEKYNAFLKKIERAEKWDSAAIYDIRDSFKHGYFRAEGMELDFSAHYGKDGLYPDRADLTDGNYTYISRWANTREYKALNRLPLFGEKDIIAGSDTLQYDWQTLVLRMDALEPDYQSSINAVWIANQESAANYERSGDGTIAAENPITGEIAEWKRTDFLGVLRPEKAAKIDYEALKNEYLTLTAAHSVGVEGEDAWGMEA